MKKFVSMMLALVMVLSLVPSAFAAETVSASDKFTDVSADAWYLDELNYALANGYISGTSTSTFSPSDKITRGQFVTILGRMLGVSVSSGSTKFTDVDETSWYAPYVAWAAQNGYVNGTSSSTFSPESTITCEQMGVIIANYISKSGVELSGYTASPAYKDASSISSWAVSSMELMRQYGLLVTDAAGNVNPQNSVNRAGGTVSLVRLAKATGLGEAPVIQSTVTEQKPSSLANQPVLSGRGITYADLIPGNPQLITSHAVDDMEAIDNNIRYMLKNGLTEIPLDIASSQALCVNYCYGLNLYPEFGYNYVTDTSTGAGKTRIKLGNSYMSNATLAKYQEDAFEAAIKVHDDLWASGEITSTMTQMEKALVYYTWVVCNCGYSFSFGDGAVYMPYGVFYRGEAVCQGYTGAYNMLLKLEGIDCSTAVYEPESHMWTTAVLDGTLYHMDATWEDSVFLTLDYFCMTPEESWKLHTEDGFFSDFWDDWDDDWDDWGW